MGKVIELKNYMNKVDEKEDIVVSDVISSDNDSYFLEKGKEKKVNLKRKNVIINLLKFISKFKLKNKISMILIVVAIATLAVVKAETPNVLTEESYSYIESFNIDMSNQLNGEVNKKASLVNPGDVVVTINPTVEGDAFAVYNTTVNLTLKSSDIKVKNGNVSFKVKDVKIEVIDITPLLSAEELAMLSDESIKAIAKESVSLSKKLEKELKKETQFIEELIKSNL